MFRCSAVLGSVLVYPGTGGSFGIVANYLSSDLVLFLCKGERPRAQQQIKTCTERQFFTPGIELADLADI